MSFIIDEEAKGATAKSKITEEEQEEEATKPLNNWRLPSRLAWTLLHLEAFSH